MEYQSKSIIGDCVVYVWFSGKSWVLLWFFIWRPCFPVVSHGHFSKCQISHIAYNHTWRKENTDKPYQLSYHALISCLFHPISVTDNSWSDDTIRCHAKSSLTVHVALSVPTRNLSLLSCQWYNHYFVTILSVTHTTQYITPWPAYQLSTKQLAGSPFLITYLSPYQSLLPTMCNPVFQILDPRLLRGGVHSAKTRQYHQS